MMDKIDLITQPSQIINARISLLSSSLQPVGTFSGTIVSMSFNVDNSSAIRRTLALSVSSPDATGVLQSIESIWIDKIVMVEYGIYDFSMGDYQWFKLGTFVLSNSSYGFGVGEQQVDMNLIDLMGLASDPRGSQIGHDVTVYMDSDIKAALTATINDFTHLSQCDIINFDATVPYDLEFSKGIYPLDILNSLIELYLYYEQYFNKDGVYTVRLLPMTYYDELALTADDMNKIIIDDTGGGDYSEIANAIEVWGMELDAQYTAKTCETINNDTYKLFIDETFEVLEDGMTVSFTTSSSNLFGQKIQIQETAALPLYIQRGDGTYVAIGMGAMKNDTAYCVKYTDNRYVLQGELLIHAVAIEFNAEPSEEYKTELKKKYDTNNISFVINPGSRFAADQAGIGIVNRVLSGGDYENIYTTELALERARYELWKATRLRNSKQITCVFVPWLEVNEKIEYSSIVDGVTKQFLVENISTNFDGTMTLTISEFFPLYQWLTNTTWGGLTRHTWNDVKDVKWGNIDEFGR